MRMYKIKVYNFSVCLNVKYKWCIFSGEYAHGCWSPPAVLDCYTPMQQHHHVPQ